MWIPLDIARSARTNDIRDRRRGDARRAHAGCTERDAWILQSGQCPQIQLDCACGSIKNCNAPTTSSAHVAQDASPKAPIVLRRRAARSRRTDADKTRNTCTTHTPPAPQKRRQRPHVCGKNTNNTFALQGGRPRHKCAQQTGRRQQHTVGDANRLDQHGPTRRFDKDRTCTRWRTTPARTASTRTAICEPEGHEQVHK